MHTITYGRKIAVLLIFTLVAVAGFSQNTVNSYKYVLLPQKFDFQSSINEYQLNSTAKALLEKKGFTVFWINDNLPQYLAANKCNALVADITQRKAIFTTNLTLSLKDCYGNTIFKGKEGRSWEKEFDVAFNEALKNAFTTLNALPYKYDSAQTAQSAQSRPSTLTAQQQPAAATPATASAPAAAAPAPAAATATTPSAASATTAPELPGANETLYAQPITNGYQLIDATPKKVMTLLKTSLQDCFLAQTIANPGGTSPGATDRAATSPNAPNPGGIVFKNNNQWFFEYYKDGTLVSQKLTIKF